MNKLSQTHIRYARRHARNYLTFTRRAYLAKPDLKTESGFQAVYDRLLFSLLSVNESFEVTASAYSEMRGAIWRNERQILDMYLRHGVHYALARANYLARASELFIADPLAFIKRPRESFNAYRGRLVALIPGLSWIKVSFFIGMIYRQADVCCIDRHMLRALGAINADRCMTLLSPGPIGQWRYQSLENVLRKGAQSAGLPLPAFQWAVWDSVQNSINNMEVLYGTD
jgi:thermostable 8-oxoguanine DNA glycosylase